MTSKDRCLSKSQVADLLAERLSGIDETTVVEHLDHCPSCRRRAEAAASSDEFWAELRGRLGTDDTSLDHDREHERRGPGESRDALALLGPSDFPTSLGRIGAYEVKSVIGRGATGVVFKAYEPSLNRFVAIKLLSPALASSPVAKRRFEQEARAIAAVSHDHVVPIFGTGEHAGSPYIVMRYVPGLSLQRRLDLRGQLGPRESVRIGMQVVSGLAAAHAQGIVHRDIKPANILLEHDLERALVTDFGLARAAHEVPLTQTGGIAGTPEYMSPEQIKGEALDPRSDLFSLGAVLYAMAAGYPPFRSTTAYGVMWKICEHEPTPLRAINAETPAWYEELTAGLLRQDPADRPQSAESIAQILESELAHMQSPRSFPQPARDWRTPVTPAPRPRGRLAVALAAAPALLGAVWIAHETGLIGANPPRSDPNAVASSEGSASLFQNTIRRTFARTPGRPLLIETDYAIINIQGADIDEITLEAERVVSARDTDHAEARLDQHSLDFTSDDRGMRLNSRFRGEHTGTRRFTLNLAVPRDQTVVVNGGLGHVRVQDLEAPLTIDARSGLIDLRHVSGTIDASTGGGHIRFEALSGAIRLSTDGGLIGGRGASGSTTVHSDSGNVDVRGVTGSLTATTDAGGVFAQFIEPPAGDGTIRSIGADVHLVMPAESSVTLTGGTQTGRVRRPPDWAATDLPIEVNGGGPLIRLESDTGDIIFEPADSERSTKKILDPVSDAPSGNE